MPLYRFVGANTEVGSVKLSKFGQPVELTDELARDVLAGGGSILPSDQFDEIGFTEQELSLYSDNFSHGQANAAFQDKKKRALLLSHDARTKLSAPAETNYEPIVARHEPDAPLAEAVEL